MPHTTPKNSRIPGPLHKAGLFVLFAAITAALCLLLNFCWWMTCTPIPV